MGLWGFRQAASSALALYEAGNQEFVQAHYAQALARYKQAILQWDHPAIRFNMAVCLINIDEPVEARENLERSLAYGAAVLRCWALIPMRRRWRIASCSMTSWCA